MTCLFLGIVPTPQFRICGFPSWICLKTAETGELLIQKLTISLNTCHPCQHQKGHEYSSFHPSKADCTLHKPATMNTEFWKMDNSFISFFFERRTNRQGTEQFFQTNFKPSCHWYRQKNLLTLFHVLDKETTSIFPHAEEMVVDIAAFDLHAYFYFPALCLIKNGLWIGRNEWNI